MSTRNFTHINESFTCAFCGREVHPLKIGGCRNHCPYCLSSVHVDLLPGDRSNPCKGRLEATGYETNPKKGLVLIFTCVKCGKITKNKAATEDPEQPDDYDQILLLSPKL